MVTEAKKSGIRHIVKQSIIGADLKADVGAMRLHRQEEKVIENSGIPYTFLRSNAFMQNFVNFYGHVIKAQNAFYLPTGNGKVSFVDVRDIAAVAVQALTKNGSQHVNKVMKLLVKKHYSIIKLLRYFLTQQEKNRLCEYFR